MRPKVRVSVAFCQHFAFLFFVFKNIPGFQDSFWCWSPFWITDCRCRRMREKEAIRHLHTSHDTHFICGEYQKHRTRWLNVVHRRVQWKPTKQKQRNLTGFMTIPPYLLWLQRSVFYWAKNIFYYVKHANDFSNANSKLRQKAIGTEGFSVSCSFIARWFYRSPYHDSHLSPNFTFLFRIHWWA